MKTAKIFHILNITLFSVTVAGLCLFTLILPKRDFSEPENRYLSDLPEFSARTWFSGDFADGLAEYSREHFALRTRWISLRTRLERIAGHDEVNGVYISDGRYFEVAEDIDYDAVDRTVEALNSFSDRCGGKLSVMLVPTSAQIYADRLPSYSKDQEQRKMINYVYENLDEDIGKINVFDSLMRERDGYIYYRTDHHWTTYGAYVAYTVCMNRFGYDPVTLDKINVEHASHSFYGSYYSKVLSEEAEPDTVDFYTSGGAEVKSVKITRADGTTEERDSVIFREYLEKKDKYLCFLGENVPLIEITSDAGGGSILIIKDSYANCFVPFLTKHFSKVTVVDLRYMMDLSDYCDPAEADRILLLYNASTFAGDRNIVKLGQKAG